MWDPHLEADVYINSYLCHVVEEVKRLFSIFRSLF